MLSMGSIPWEEVQQDKETNKQKWSEKSEEKKFQKRGEGGPCQK